MSDATTPAPAGPAQAGSLDDRRTTPRFHLLIRTAKVISAEGEVLCVVRDASSQGVRIKTFAPLPPDHETFLELANGERLRIVKVWEKGDTCGFRFAEGIDFARLVTEAPPRLCKRELRLNCLVPGMVSAGSGTCEVVIHDISQRGARIECAVHLALAERIRLDCGHLPALDATVQWRQSPFYGVLLDRVFTLDELAQLGGTARDAPAGRGQGSQPA